MLLRMISCRRKMLTLFFKSFPSGMRLGGCCAASYSDFLVTLCSVAMKRNKLSEGKMKKQVIIFEGVEIEYQESAEGSSVSVPG